ncbi:MAG: hypothetical protein ACRDQ5_06765 [Sciscionella sp.]
MIDLVLGPDAWYYYLGFALLMVALLVPFGVAYSRYSRSLDAQERKEAGILHEEDFVRELNDDRRFDREFAALAEQTRRHDGTW